MEDFLTKNRLILFAVAFVFISYFLLRIPNLTTQPIFADEAIYIRWAQIMKADPSLRFVPLSDGKTPLFMWIMIPLFKIFKDPLFAGRILSIFSGFITLIGTLFLGWKFFDKRIGIVGAALVAVVPFMVFFDRMALVDSMLAAFSIWALNFALLLSRYPRFDLSMILGYSFGAALLTKPSGIFEILVLPISALGANLKMARRQRMLLKLLGLWAIAIIITLAIYSVLKLAPNYVNIDTRTQNYLITPAEFLKNPFDPFLPHLKDTFDFMFRLFSIPLVFFLTISIGIILLTKNWTGWAILLWSLLPMVIEMAGIKAFTARYILFSIPPLLVLTAFGIVSSLTYARKKRLLLSVLTVFVIAIFTLGVDYSILTDPTHAPLPKK